MDFITNTVIIIISFVGLVIGLILSNYTKDELKSGKKYFTLFKRIILIVLIVALLFQAFPNYLWVFIFFVVGILVSFLFRKIYFYLGLALFTSFLVSKGFVALISSLVFIFGLPYGTPFHHNKNKIRFIIFNFILFIIPFVLFLFKDFIYEYNYIFLAFLAGVFLNIVRK